MKSPAAQRPEPGIVFNAVARDTVTASPAPASVRKEESKSSCAFPCSVTNCSQSRSRCSGFRSAVSAIAPRLRPPEDSSTMPEESPAVLWNGSAGAAVHQERDRGDEAGSDYRAAEPARFLRRPEGRLLARPAGRQDTAPDAAAREGRAEAQCRSDDEAALRL